MTRQHNENWNPARTAIIICDMWDLHHSLNAVHRLEEFAPRLNEVLTRARELGVVIIHAPSDCMDFYADHPARRRAMAAPPAANAPKGVEQWCVQITAEQDGDYPIDQSDGGEDDDPAQLAKWGEHLKSIGRNPRGPWKSQTPLLTIDEEKDYISSIGDEVWNVLEDRGIDNVILAGVHLNMCVLGRPFGLRQMVRGGKHVVLMRDMTDTMYNPKRWPYVNHFEGTDRVVAYVERNICPTITSDQIIGGEPFRFKDDRRDARVVSVRRQPNPRTEWVKVSVPANSQSEVKNQSITGGAGWYRCVIRVPTAWKQASFRLTLPEGSAGDQAWINGHALREAGTEKGIAFTVDPDSVEFGTANLLVVKLPNGDAMSAAPFLTAGDAQLQLRGNWQYRIGDDSTWSGIPLPAQFGGPGDVVFQPAEDVR